MPSVSFASIHCYLDFASGASISIRDLLLSLRERGWRCDVLCGSGLDSPDLALTEVFGGHGLLVAARRGMKRVWSRIDSTLTPRCAGRGTNCEKP